MRWSIYYALNESNLPAIREAVSGLLAPDEFSIVTEVLEGGEEGAAQLGLDVDAGSLAGALSVAAGLWAQLHAKAGVPRTAAHLTYIIGPWDQPATFHDTLLMRAAQVLGSSEPSYALVAAVSAYEVYERQLVRDLAARDMPADVAEGVWTVYKHAHRTGQQQFLEKLLGTKLEAAGQAWVAYKASLKSRQGIVHEGAVVDHETAAQALAAIRDLISWIESKADPSLR